VNGGSSQNTEAPENNTEAPENGQDYEDYEDYEIEENKTLTQTTYSLSIILAASITPVGIVLIVISVLLMVIPTRMWSKYPLLLHCNRKFY